MKRSKMNITTGLEDDRHGANVRRGWLELSELQCSYLTVFPYPIMETFEN